MSSENLRHKIDSVLPGTTLKILSITSAVLLFSSAVQKVLYGGPDQSKGDKIANVVLAEKPVIAPSVGTKKFEGGLTRGLNSIDDTIATLDENSVDTSRRAQTYLSTAQTNLKNKIRAGTVVSSDIEAIQTRLKNDIFPKIDRHIKLNNVRGNAYDQELIQNLENLRQAVIQLNAKEKSDYTWLYLLIGSIITGLLALWGANTPDAKRKKEIARQAREIATADYELEMQKIQFNHYLEMKRKQYQKQLNEQDFHNENQKNYVEYLRSMFAKKGIEKNQTEAEQALSIKLNERILEILEMRKNISDNNVDFRNKQKAFEASINENAIKANQTMLEIKALIDNTYKNRKEEFKNSYLAMLVNRYNKELEEAIMHTKNNVSPDEEAFKEMNLKNAETTVRNFGKLQKFYGVYPNYIKGYFERSD